MAQTKRKRRSKHRGTAAGTIESRGRTGRRPSADEQKKPTRADARARRLSKPPTWKSAATKASMMALLLFAFTQVGLLGKNASIAQGVFLGLLAFALYTPLAYWTDRFVYQRAQKQRARSGGG